MLDTVYISIGFHKRRSNMIVFLYFSDNSDLFSLIISVAKNAWSNHLENMITWFSLQKVEKHVFM